MKASHFGLLLLSAKVVFGSPLYTVTNLGSNVSAFAINNAGQVTGQATNSDYSYSYAFLYSNGVMIDIGGYGSYGAAINDLGQIVGAYPFGPNKYEHGFLFSNGVMADINSGTMFSNTHGINDSGQIVGSYWSPGPGQSAFITNNGIINTIGGGSMSDAAAAMSINDLGQVVGNFTYSYDTFGNPTNHAFLYSNGVVTDLNSQVNGGQVRAINDTGQITGSFIDSSRISHAFLYGSGVLTDVGLLGGLGTAGYAMNNLGQIVGSSVMSSGVESDAFLYSGGLVTDLNSLIANDLGIRLVSANGINDSGQIVADGFNSNGQNASFLLTPVSGASTPEPSTWTMFGVGFMLFGICPKAL